MRDSCRENHRQHRRRHDAAPVYVRRHRSPALQGQVLHVLRQVQDDGGRVPVSLIIVDVKIGFFFVIQKVNMLNPDAIRNRKSFKARSSIEVYTKERERERETTYIQKFEVKKIK